MAEDAGLDVSTAAVRLGISVAAVRKRIHRGTLKAYKRDGAWRVILPSREDAATESGYDAGRMTGSPAGQDAGKDALIAHLAEEVDFLRRLTEHQAGVIAELSRPVPELAAPISPPAAVVEPPPPAPQEPATPRVRRPWYAFWKAR